MGCNWVFEYNNILFEELQKNTTLIEFDIPYFSNTTGLAVANLLAANKTIKKVNLYARHQNVDEFYQIVKNNYTLIDCGNVHPFLDDLCERNLLVQPSVVQKTIADFVISMSSLDIPSYICLWIVDWIPFYDVAHKEKKKITLIQSVKKSLKSLKERDSLQNKLIKC